MEDRIIILLKAAKELLIKQRQAGILIDHPLTAHYDDTDCDGYCLIDDIAAQLEELGDNWKYYSSQEFIDMQTKYDKQRENERKLYDELIALRKNLSGESADSALNSVVGLCQKLLGLDFTQPIKVVKPQFTSFREHCPCCGYSHRVTLATLSKDCPICHTRLQEEDE